MEINTLSGSCQSVQKILILKCWCLKKSGICVLNNRTQWQFLSILFKKHVSTITASRFPDFYKRLYRKNCVLRKKEISPFTLKIHYKLYEYYLFNLYELWKIFIYIFKTFYINIFFVWKERSPSYAAHNFFLSIEDLMMAGKLEPKREAVNRVDKNLRGVSQIQYVCLFTRSSNIFSIVWEYYKMFPYFAF
jgi:hypothetical protein